MIEFVRKYGIMPPDQRCYYACVCHVSCGKQQCPREPGKGCQCLLQQMVCSRMTADEMRRTCSNTILRRTFANRCNQFGMIGKTEIIVAAKCQVFTTVYRNPSGLRTLKCQAITIQAPVFAATQVFAQVFPRLMD